MLPIPEDFDAVTATDLADLAVSAYDQGQAWEDGQQWDAPLGYAFYAQVTTGQNWNDWTPGVEQVPVGWIGTRDETIYVVFRGTSTNSEALLDLDAVQVDYPFLEGDGGGTHGGFTDRYAELHPQVLEVVETLAATGDFSRIALTGHSLGGAIATMSGATLAEATNMDVSVYSVGSPRVGDIDFVQRFEALVADTWRITNPWDVVPGYPPEAPFAPDSEFGQLFYDHVEVRVDLVFDDANGKAEQGLGFGGNHSSCRYLQEVCELQDSDAGCRARVEAHASCD